tara:strand:- start:372 stop:1118 length:747 start_codon:yes stop_codon:yes gene_type:complete
MSYQDYLEHFFKQRAASFKLKGVDVDMNKQSFVHSYIECGFGSLPKDSIWIEKWDGEINESGYSKLENKGEYDFSGTIKLHFIDFNFSVRHLSEENIKNYKKYMSGDQGLYDGDWDSHFHDDNVGKHIGTPYQFAKGNFTIDNMEFEDYLILDPDFYSEYGGGNVWAEPWNGRYTQEEYKGYRIFHPTKKKFVRVSLSADDNFGDPHLFLDVSLKDKKQVEKLSEIYDGQTQFRYGIDVQDYISRLKL